MRSFTKLISTAIPIRSENIDTDQIIPARFLKTTKREGLGRYLFYYWRFDEKGKSKKENIFLNLGYKKAKILIAGNNFGCGSSREHSVWALQDYGFQVLISSSFGDIFYNNALKNGFLAVVLKPKELEKLFSLVEKEPRIKITIDLAKQTVFAKKFSFRFPIDSFRKKRLLKGVNELRYILLHEVKIKKFELTHTSFLSRT